MKMQSTIETYSTMADVAKGIIYFSERHPDASITDCKVQHQDDEYVLSLMWDN